MLVSIASWALALDQGFRIDRYDVYVHVHENSIIDVQEEIRVTFLESRRGIFREIPFRYELAEGKRRVVTVSNVQVPGHEFNVSDSGSMKKIRIGNADTWLPAGQQVTYNIQYRVEGAINWYESNEDWKPWAEIYWNIIGAGWDTTIAKTNYRVTFPHKSGMQLRARVLVGGYGQRDGITLSEPGRQYDPALKTSAVLNEGELTGTVERTLNPGEAVTVILGVPSTLLPEPPLIAKLGRFIRNNAGLLLPIIVGVIQFLAWLIIGRDPKLGPVGVRFEPPEGVDAAFCGVLIDDKVDGRDIAAAIMSLAVKGHIKFVSLHKHGTFENESTVIQSTDRVDAGNLSPFEQGVLTALAPPLYSVPVTDLRYRLADSLPTLARELRSRLVDEGYYRSDPAVVKANVVQPFVIAGAICIFGFGGVVAALNYFDLHLPLATTITGALLCIPVIVFFAHIMPARTRLGALRHHECLGFYEAMHRRSHFMDWFTKTNLDMAKYEQYLPYAVAFGLTKEWSEICGNVVTEMPSFYESDRDVFNAYWLSSSLDRDFRYMSNDFTPAINESYRSESGSAWDSDGGWGGGSSGSSGFGGGGGGGGFSGGGFGGGGGGSW